MEHINPISDELIAAYLEGNTTPEETRAILFAMQHDSELREVLSVVTQSNETDAISLYPMQCMAADNPKNLCAFYAELYVLRQRGLSIDEQILLQTAQDNHWVTEQGTPLYAIGNVLASQGLMVTRQYDATIDEIVAALHKENDVIVAVDVEKLYPNRPDPDDAPNHAMVVTAVKNEANVISLFVPEESAVVDFPMSAFMVAWRESRNYMIRVLRSVEEYEPHPLNLDDVPLTDDLLELQEAIAENVHEVWAAARVKEGWVYGKERNEALKQHPDLVPYSALPEGEKEYDRITAMNTIKLVKKLGWSLVK